MPPSNTCVRCAQQALADAATSGAGAVVAAKKQPVLVLCGPNGGGRELLAAQLVASFPDTFVAPGYITDRKPAKGESSTPALTFVSGKELSKAAGDGRLALQRPGDGAGKDAGQIAITGEALEAVTGANKVAVIDLPESALAATLPFLRTGKYTAGALFVYVASPDAAAAAAADGTAGLPPAAPPPSTLETFATDARASEQYQLIVEHGAGMELVSIVRDSLCTHVPEVVPPPLKPLVVAGPFGAGKRGLLRRLFDALPGKFAAPVTTTTKETVQPELDDRCVREGGGRGV